MHGVTTVRGSALATARALRVCFRLPLVVAALVYAAVGALFLLAARRAAAEPDPPVSAAGLEPI